MDSVVIVPGIGSHAFGSFKDKGGEYMWPRDGLPQELVYEDRKVARVLTYGYVSGLSDKNNVQSVTDIAEAFSSNLSDLLSKADTKPIVFIGHSMGGVVIKQVWFSLCRKRKHGQI